MINNFMDRIKIMKDDRLEVISSTSNFIKTNTLVPKRYYGNVINVRQTLSDMIHKFAMRKLRHALASHKSPKVKMPLKVNTNSGCFEEDSTSKIMKNAGFFVHLSLKNDHSKNEDVVCLVAANFGEMIRFSNSLFSLLPDVSLYEFAQMPTVEGVIFTYTYRFCTSLLRLELQLDRDSEMFNNPFFWSLFTEKSLVRRTTDYRYASRLRQLLSGHYKEIVIVLDSTGEPGQKLLHKASFENNINLVEYLLEKEGVDVNIRDTNGNTALSLASERGHFDLVEYLLLKDANVNCTNKEVETPLHKAARNGDLSMMKLLLRNEAVIIDLPNKWEATPLHVALQNDQIEMAKLLINNGADVNYQTDDEVSALFIFIERYLKRIDENGALYKLMKEKDAYAVNEFYIRRRELYGPVKRNKMAEKLFQEIIKMKKKHFSK